jgi:hypothetical protein
MKKMIFILMMLLPLLSAASEQERIESAVKASVSKYLSEMANPYWRTGYGSAFYYIPFDLQNALRYAKEHRNDTILDDMSALVLESAKRLKRTQYYAFKSDKCEVRKLNAPYLMWLPPEKKCAGLPKEIILETAQYSYFVASLLNAITHSDYPTANMLKVVKIFPRIIAYDTYYRLIFASAPFNRFGWGCGIGDFSGHQNIAVLTKRLYGKLPGSTNTKPYCNVVTDTELLLLGGVAELIAADENRIGVTKDINILYPLLKGHLKGYLVNGSRLLKSRTKDYEISPGIWGQTFGAGDWDGHRDYQYSGYNGYAYPKETDKSEKQTAWDISHARRLVHVLESMLNVAGSVGFSYPSRQDMERLANQFYYKVFNGDKTFPRFSNYMNGDNGWYRVGYRGREGYGIEPYGFTAEATASGYGFWAKYNQDIRPVIAKAIENKPNDLQSLPSIGG